MRTAESRPPETVTTLLISYTQNKTLFKITEVP